MPTYKTPGVYVEEISTLPPSVAEVETAIPAFIGFTETGARNTPQRIASLVEYQYYFGTAEPEKSITVTVQEDRVTNVSIDPATKSKNTMYYSLQLYFANGGGPCYIVSTGNFADSANDPGKAYDFALDAISKEDEPTLLVFPDAPLLLAPEDYYALMNDALMECKRLGDRFAIIDVLDKGDTLSSVAQFRQMISSNLDEIKYGASYYPYLNTTLSYKYDEGSVTVLVADADKARDIDDSKQTAITSRAEADAARAEADKAKKAAADAEAGDAAAKKAAATDAAKKADEMEKRAKEAETKASASEKAAVRQKFADQSNALQNQIKKKISELDVQLSPCGAVAGVYASVDSTRGVWKAPANVSLNYVKSTSTRITDDDQRDMNIDVTAGKSVNAIRSFIGMGTKIWGARTLAGNDNEWRYVNVRRFFNMVEESVKKSTYWAVFEPNDKNTWTKVRAMIENYLMLKWKDGALAGSKPDDAYFVRVGLGQTMSPQDVLEGRMIVEIGLAAVRPAEFIILKFSHKIQNS